MLIGFHQVCLTLRLLLGVQLFLPHLWFHTIYLKIFQEREYAEKLNPFPLRFGFVRFETPEGMQAALAQTEHWIGSRRVEVRAAENRLPKEEKFPLPGKPTLRDLYKNVDIMPAGMKGHGKKAGGVPSAVQSGIRTFAVRLSENMAASGSPGEAGAAGGGGVEKGRAGGGAGASYVGGGRRGGDQGSPVLLPKGGSPSKGGGQTAKGVRTSGKGLQHPRGKKGRAPGRGAVNDQQFSFWPVETIAMSPTTDQYGSPVQFEAAQFQDAYSYHHFGGGPPPVVLVAPPLQGTSSWFSGAVPPYHMETTLVSPLPYGGGSVVSAERYFYPRAERYLDGVGSSADGAPQRSSGEQTHVWGDPRVYAAEMIQQNSSAWADGYNAGLATKTGLRDSEACFRGEADVRFQ